MKHKASFKNDAILFDYWNSSTEVLKSQFGVVVKALGQKPGHLISTPALGTKPAA